MSQQLQTEWFVTDGKWNAVIAWTITGILVLAAVNNLLDFRLVDLLLAGTAVVLASIPAVVSRSWTRTVPWPLVFIAALPILVGSLDPTFFKLAVIGAGVAALGMLLVVDLQLTTAVRMTPGFAVWFVVMMTLAFAGAWAVSSAFEAAYFGGTFVQTNTELMNIFTAALVGGLVGGLAFRLYFRRELRRQARSTPGAEGWTA
ncbi:hypothetical protein [Haloarchaeobius sp. DFWS5]|uniref:hypothetical protein n=1 Tax=Haloarchaeobius sp. DFWS5 TaxID=3446114 RepID=UPI003EB9F86E